MAQAASDKERSESWLDTLASAASQLGAGEAIAELREQARELMADVRRAAAEMAEAGEAGDVGTGGENSSAGADESAASHAPGGTSSGAAESAAGRAVGADASAVASLASRLDGLSSSLEEVADLLDAGLERLETVEMQLGDPDDSVDARLRSGIERCEQRLGGIEHRLRELARAAQPTQQRARVPVALVVDTDCRRRCDLCVSLEHEGIHTLASGDAAGAGRMLARQPDVVLIRHDAPRDLIEIIERDVALLRQGHARAAREGEGEGGALLVLAPWPRGRDLELELRQRFGQPCQIVTDAHGIAALADEIHDRTVLQHRQAPPPAAETEETTPDASV
ncbi:MAG TPA: hypothetical protein VEC57_01925 [Candidatus Limnocylindrales bacterium]|nr:hypothetical protein [Candidatus Limnocylindrales bacterium]